MNGRQSEIRWTIFNIYLDRSQKSVKADYKEGKAYQAEVKLIKTYLNYLQNCSQNKYRFGEK